MMNKREIAALLRGISDLFSDFKYNDMPEDKQLEIINQWHFALGEFEANDIMVAYKSWLTTSGSKYAPKAPELVAELNKRITFNTPNAAEAWAIIRKAISRSIYDSERQFAALTPAMQRAVGSANQLREYAMSDVTKLDTVVASNVQKAYREAVDQITDFATMPKEMRNLISETTAKMPQMIGVVDDV